MVTEGDDALGRGLVGNYSTGDVVILHGCVLTGSVSGAGNPYSITAGAIFYNGEVYQVPAKNGVISGANVLMGTVTPAYASGDPVQQDDLSLFNQHKIVTLVIDQGTSGGGVGNYANFRHTLSEVSAEISDIAGVAVSATSWTQLTSMTFTTPNDGLTRKYLLMFKAVCVGSNGVATNTVNFRIRNVTDTTTLDQSQFSQTKTTVTDVATGVPTCMAIVSIGPNKVISVEREWIVGTTTVSYIKFIRQEVR